MLRRLFAVALFALAVSAAVPAKPAQAVWLTVRHYRWYDAAGNQVGYRYLDMCTGESYFEGVKTDTVVLSTTRCWTD